MDFNIQQRPRGQQSWFTAKFEYLERTLTILKQSVTKLNEALEAKIIHFFLSLDIHKSILNREKYRFTEKDGRFGRFCLGQNVANGTILLKWDKMVC